MKKADVPPPSAAQLQLSPVHASVLALTFAASTPIVLHGDESVRVEQLAESVALLYYPYRSGKHDPRNLKQFASICQQVLRLHEAEVVHSDVRPENMVFDEEGNDAWLIDFDFSAVEGEPYPRTYRGSANDPEGLWFRDRNAQRLKPRRKEHDLYSLMELFRRWFPEQNSSGRPLDAVMAVVELASASGELPRTGATSVFQASNDSPPAPMRRK